MKEIIRRLLYGISRGNGYALPQIYDLVNGDFSHLKDY